MAEASGHKSKQKTTNMNIDLNLIKNEVWDALTGVPYVDNNCTPMFYVRDGKMCAEIVHVRRLDTMRRNKVN